MNAEFVNSQDLRPVGHTLIRHHHAMSTTSVNRYISDQPDTRLLSGDWMFLRSAQIPSPPGDGESETGKSSSLLDLSKKAARAVYRKRCLQMWGVSDLLGTLQDLCESDRPKEQPSYWLRERLMLKHNTQFKRKMRDDPREDWASDDLFKIAALTDEVDPEPRTLDWAASLTWIALERGAVTKGCLPPDLVLYAAAAIETLDRKSSAAAFRQVSVDSDQTWVASTQRRVDAYLQRPFTLLDPSGETSIRPLTRPDTQPELRHRILCVSHLIRRQLQQWRILSDD